MGTFALCTALAVSFKSAVCSYMVMTVRMCCSDLSGGNVMLRNVEDSPHGNVAAKVADFGLSRTMDVQSRMQTRMYGTVRHVAYYMAVSRTRRIA